MDNKKKERSQLKDAEILFYLSWFIMIMIFILLATSCNTAAQTPEEEKIYINIDGENVELVADEYGGQYLKQVTAAGIIYIPYIGVVEEQSDSLKFYNTKN
jgi:hypothetical protein